MKKILSVFVMMLIASTTVLAQDKKTVAIEEFTSNSNIESNWVETLRNNIIAGITATSRVNVIDVKTLSSIPTAKEERLNALTENGVDIVLSCHFVSMNNTKDDNKYVSKDNYSITLTDAHTGGVISTTPFEDSWHVGDNETEAINKCLEYANSNMKKFVDNNFKFEAIVKQLDQVDAKKGAKTAYVSIGSNAGIQAGQMFDILEEIVVGDDKITKKIGDAKAQEVVSGTMTLVKITKGGEEIKSAYDKQHRLIVVTRAKKDPLGSVGIKVPTIGIGGL